ncbi:energy transducer TonB [Lutibacter holmesii]|uniref:Energy transducer TonB n=1 Tax=Lutibacter holmesii TaxID=1137985 RepID=A0ABW3WLC4_9FLAO
MQVKKYPHAALENYSKILMQLGLVLSLFIVYESIELKSYPKEVKELVGTFVAVDDNEQIVEFKKIEIVPPKVVQSVIPDKILKVDDEVEVNETIIESTETDESEAIIVADIENEVVEIEEVEEVVEDVPFMVIENVPIFPGCTGTNEELRACFSRKVSKLVNKEFNPHLAADLGLPRGSIQKIFVMFRIDKNGDIVDVKARAPHKRLQTEAIRVVNSLPKMIPGKQRGMPVGVKYALPITFRIE